MLVVATSGVDDDRTEQRKAELRETDPRFQDTMPDRTVEAAKAEPGLPLGRLIECVMQGYADRPAAGERRTELVTDPASGRHWLRLLPEFETITYGELLGRATALATEWAERGVRPGDVIATIGFTSIDYVTLDLAAIRLGAISVPLQPSGSVDQLGAIVEETEPRLFATSPAYLDKAIELATGAESVQGVVVFDHHPGVDDERDAVASAEATLRAAGRWFATLGDLLDHGRTLPAAPTYVPEPEPGEDPLTLLVYTSGSTGTPKGAMYPDRIVRGFWTGVLPVEGDVPAITVNFMPLSHMFGRAVVYDTFSRGGINYFTANSDLSSLFEDIGLARPTTLVAVPRIFDMLFQEYQAQRTLLSGKFTDETELDAVAKADLRERFLGGRLINVSVGSAPTSAEIVAFIESVLDVPLHNLYGTTEFGMGLWDGVVQRPPVLDYKLIDVPELDYFTTDQPHPRGELLIKSATIFPGYYRRPETTASVFDEDGYYRTGDIMAETSPDHLVYVDRRNNVQKLSQGEFVALSKVESALTSSPLVRQIYVYGNAARPYLLAVIVPVPSALSESGDPEALKAKLAESLSETARATGLESYEIPRDFLVETEPFSMANGLLSDIRKLLRPRLRERYGDQLEQLYADIERGQDDELRVLRAGGPGQPVYQTVTRAVTALLGCDSADVKPGNRFIELGGDSLSALSFSRLLQDIFAIDVPVGVVISPANDLRAIADYIENERASASGRPTVTSVHGADATVVRASDLRLEKFFDAQTLEAAENLPRHDGEPTTVLLTGATGFLGRFMCLDWLERLAERNGKLICLVRATDDDTARERLDQAFDSGDPELLRHYRELAGEYLEVLAGDLGEPHLGLAEPVWQRLADEVDVIMHPGALVNHVLPYEQLFGPNVVGTAELIRLAITTKLKPFTNLSTVGVADQVTPGTFSETPDIRVLSPVRRREDSYANGYSLSKWAGEVLLREAHDAYGLPVTVFRSDLILAHSRYVGQLNVPDMFTRLLLSVLATGIAPDSFYRSDDGTRPTAHYDGLPVDFTAESVNTIGAEHVEGYHTYHLLNPHEDGISLDTFVDWLIEAGHRIERVPDYAGWLRRFGDGLRSLPETKRRHSLLPLLHSYEQPAEPVRAGTAPADEFRKAVRAAKVGELGDIPHITRELILKYGTDLRSLGLI